MPIYEYECNACHHHVEVTQSIKDAPLKHCDACGKDELQKLISRSAFHLKGGGWYSDLYSSTSGDKKKSESSSTSDSSPAASTSTTSSSTTSTPAASTSTSSSEKKAEGRSAAA